MNTRILSIFLILILGSSVQALEEQKLYHKKASWEKTMTASKTAYQSWEQVQVVRLSPWRATKPLKINNISTPLFP